MIHITFYSDKEDLFARGKNYTGDISEAISLWREEHPTAIFCSAVQK